MSDKVLFECLSHGIFNGEAGEMAACPKCGAMSTLAMPIALDVEFTSRCSASCLMCPRGQPTFTREVGDMTPELLYRIAHEIGTWNAKRERTVKWVWCHMFGESLLHPYAVEFIDVLAATGVDVAISTNAIPLNEDLAQRLLGSQVHRIILSVDGVTAETYEAIRGLSFVTMQKHVDGFLNIARERHKAGLNNPQIWIQILKLQENESEWKEFVQKYSGTSNIRNIEKYRDVEGLPNAKVFAKSVERYGGQIDGERHPGWDGADKRRETCRKPWDRMSIFWNGDVGICCYDANAIVKVGTLARGVDGKANSIHGVWLGEPMRKLREGMDLWQKSDGEQGWLPELCQNC